MAVVIYARKSTESEDRQIQSLDDQVQTLKEVALRDGVTIQDIITESKSAKTPYTRPEFQRLVSRIEAGEIDGIYTWSFNRLSRNMIDGGIISHYLQTGRLKYFRTPERYFLPEDNILLLSIENGMATSFIQDLSRNVKRGMKGKADRGWMPGKAPLGYLNNLRTHEIDPDPDRFDIVQKGWRMLLTGGYTVSEVFRELKRLELNGLNKNGSIKPISQTAVYAMFDNRFYTGLFKFRGEWLEGKQVPMVSIHEFERVQELLGRSTRKKRKHDHLLAGILRCGQCGCQIVGETKHKYYPGTKRHVAYTYYHCTGAKGCSKKGTSEARILEPILGFIDKIRLDSETRNWIVGSMLRQAEQDVTISAKSLSSIDTMLESKRTRMERLTELRIDGELSASDYSRMRSEAEKDITRLELSRRSVLTENEQAIRYVKEKLDVAVKASGFEDLSTGLKRAVIAGLGDQHYLTLEKLHLGLDPVLRKIAAFEPLRDGSKRPKLDDSIALFPDWSGLVDDIRIVAKEQIPQQ